MRRVWRVAAIAVAVTGVQTPTVARSANHESPPPAATVTALSLLRTSGRAEVVVGFTGDVDVQDFALRSPHRIVIDLKGAVLKMGPHAYDGIARGGIKNIHIAQNTPNIVRVVLDVDRERDYQVVRGDTDVRIALETEDTFEPWTVGARPRVAPDASASVTPKSSAAARPASPPPAPMVMVPVSNPSAPPPATIFSAPSKPPAVVTPPTVERPLVLAAPAPAPQQTAGRISMSVRDMELRDVLALFADKSGKTIVTGISGVKISVDITDQPWDTALKALLDAYGLAATENIRSGIITVSTLATVQNQRATEQLSTVRVALNYARADTLAKTLTLLLSSQCGAGPQLVGAPPADAGAAAAGGDAGGAVVTLPAQQQAAPGAAPGVCAVRGRVTPEATTNTLIITETAGAIDSLVSYARSFDVQPRQVNIKAQIISINRTYTNQLGVSYDLGSPQASYNTLAPRTGVGSTPGEFQVTLGGDAFAGVANATRQYAASAAVNMLFSTMIGNSSLTSFIDALSQEGLTDIQSSPSINTIDKKQAKLFSGNEVAYLITPPTAPGAIQAQAAQISKILVGITLTVTPSISANRMIRLNVYAEQSSLLSKDAAGPTLSNRNATHEIFVRDGETAYISGLEQSQTTKNRRGIPLLMNLPVLGRLFSENESIEIKDDLLILITAHILDDQIPAPAGKQ